MNSAEEIYVLRDGRRLGPFSIDALLEQVERGAVSYEDACLREGSTACERVREVLDWDREPAPEAMPVSDSIQEPVPGLPDEFAPETPFEEDEDRLDFDDDELLDTLEALDDPPVSGPPSNPNSLLYAGHPSFLSFPRTILLIVVAIGCGLFFRDTSQWIFLAGLVVALFGVSWIFLERSLNLYLVTPRRVEIVTGFIAKSSNEVRIEDIRTINVVKTGLTGLIGVGSVEFASAGGGTVEVSFKNVRAANRIKGLVRRLQDARG